MTTSNRVQALEMLFIAAASLAILTVVFFASPFGCAALPVIKAGTDILLYEDGQSMLFTRRGYLRCFMTVEGPFPEWNSVITLSFKDRDAFMNLTKPKFKYPGDFWSTYPQRDEIISGSIITDKAKKTATLSLALKGFPLWPTAVNYTYDLSKPSYYKSGDGTRPPRIENKK